jgi:putative heme-binding domain-containing protein
LPELRKIYTALRPVRSWHLLGPLPIDVKPPFELDEPFDAKAKYFFGFQDEPLIWKNARAIGPNGEINLGRVYSERQDVAAYGYALLESPADLKATFSVASDDTLTVWVNGEKSYDFQDPRVFDEPLDRFDASLLKGRNQILIKCGNRGGAWRFSLAVSTSAEHGFLKGPSAGAFDPEEFRRFAVSTRGAPERGKALFSDLKGVACVKCHAVGGEGGVVGPELTSVGAKYPRDELINSVLYPSARISSGYEPVVIETTDGRILTGIIKGENPDSLELEDGDAKRVRLPKSDIEGRKRSDVSLMPNGLAEGLTQQDFADLIAYLETLKDARATSVR